MSRWNTQTNQGATDDNPPNLHLDPVCSAVRPVLSRAAGHALAEGAREETVSAWRKPILLDLSATDEGSILRIADGVPNVIEGFSLRTRRDARRGGCCREERGTGMNRALRRHQSERTKSRARRRRVIRFSGACRFPDFLNERVIGIEATTPHLCSCYECGNQRRFEGPTRQERLAVSE